MNKSCINYHVWVLLGSNNLECVIVRDCVIVAILHSFKYNQTSSVHIEDSTQITVNSILITISLQLPSLMYNISELFKINHII